MVGLTWRDRTFDPAFDPSR